MKVNVSVLDTCLSDYFQGHSCEDNEYLAAVCMRRGMTVTEFADSVVSDMNNTCPPDAFEFVTDDMIRKSVRAEVSVASIKHMTRYMEHGPTENDVYSYVLISVDTEE